MITNANDLTQFMEIARASTVRFGGDTASAFQSIMYATEIGAQAQAGLFTNQQAAFEVAPAVYAYRAYLQSFVRATANPRKYVVLTTNMHNVITFDLQESVAQGLLNVTVPPPKTNNPVSP